MNTRELSMGENQVILTRRRNNQSHCTSSEYDQSKNLECPEKNESTGVLMTRHQIGQPRKTISVDGRIFVKVLSTNPKNNSYWHHQQPPQSRDERITSTRRLQEQKREKALPQDATHRSPGNIGRLYWYSRTEKSRNSSGTTINLYQSDNVWRKKGSGNIQTIRLVRLRWCHGLGFIWLLQ